jgi:hypothetical protein
VLSWTSMRLPFLRVSVITNILQKEASFHKYRFDQILGRITQIAPV